MSVEDRVQKIVCEQLGVSAEEVKLEASFIDDLGADSLDTVELVMAFEEEFEIEIPDEDEPFIPFAANMGAAFLHGSAVTIHKAQGSQWDTVQVFAPDIYAAARMGRSEAGQPLWKRLAYVAITRAQNRLVWVVRNRLSKPTNPLSTGDLRALATAPMALQIE